MRVEYIIDGYNLLLALPGTRSLRGPGNLEKARRSMLGWIAHRVIDPGLVTVVFDSAPATLLRALSTRTEEFGLIVLFSTDYPDADAMIADLCRQHTFPKQLVVVSDDREVQRSARRRRAKPLGCEAFERLLLRGVRDARRTREPTEKQGSPSESETRYWMEIFGPVAAELRADLDPSATHRPQPKTPNPARNAESHELQRKPTGTDSDLRRFVCDMLGSVRPDEPAKPRAISDDSLDDFYRDMLSFDPDEEIGGK